jgi:acyl dehydratase
MRWFEDFEVGVWQTNGTYEMTEAEIIEVAERWDPQVFHIDPVAAADSPFGGIVACSAHLFSISCVLSSKVPEDQKAKAVSALGFDKIRLHSPARPGDVLTSRSTILETRVSQSKPHLGIIRSRTEMSNQRDELVYSMEGAALIERRDAQPDGADQLS